LFLPRRCIPDTSVVVDGLPEYYNASETYTFTVTVVNDVMEIFMTTVAS
jgi:hypothetical protein